ncbi:PREDICTED: uncharacterized protein LOC106807334 [Priapulus caudatus]|uniref:Uncharacterized protein LOC106807334 n=1 Tax=Priapulus caudatus TaxID=37621 RepID=A0ABM1DYV9_PRICU|nr:PREDICTED: uncharacterized protein LOC106807334 [Priapulus caudatus]
MPGMNGRGNAGNMRGASNANRRPGTGPRKLPPGLQKPSKSRRPHGPPPRGPKRGRTDEEYAECEQIFDKIQEKQAKKRGKPYKKFVWTDGLFESDIVIRAEQCRRIGKDYGVDVPPTSAHARTKRKLTADVSARWDPSRPIYFYIMQTNYATIRAAVGHWQDETCLNFFELDALPDQNADIDFIFIFKGPDCGGVVLDVSCGDTGTINSPSFPDFTGPRTQCSWLIKAPPGGRVAANVTSLVTHTPDLHDACRDYVELKYENNLALAGARYCGSQSLPPREVITSEKEELMVLLRMHTVSSLGKFSLTYSVSCPSVGGTTMPMETTPAPTTPLTTPLITTSSISPTDAQGYSEWTAWSSCCGRCGLEYRGRDCVEPALGCTQTITEERQCTNTRPCSAGFFGRPSCLVLRRSQSCRVDPSGRGCIRSSPHCRRYCCKDFYLDLDDKCIGLPTQQQPAQRTRGNSSKPY